jgi:hypothetical protein
MEALTAQDIADGRAWLADCTWADADEDAIAGLTREQVARGVARHYEGGWPAFLAA